MNILILMAGSGHRFRLAGYEKHKPMIEVGGEPMIKRVMDNLTPRYRDHEFIFVTLSKMTDSLTRDIIVQSNSSIIEIPYITEGSVCSALKAAGLIDNKEPLIIASCDQLVDINIDEFIDASWFSDGSLLTFPSNRQHCSFVRLDDNGNVVEVAEKKVISNHANVGIYFFRRGEDFITFAKEMIQDDFRVNGEFYIAPVYNWMIKAGKKVTIYEIPEKKVHLLGTPEELKAYDNTRTT